MKINPNVGSAAVGAAGNLLSGLINAFTQKRAQKRQHKYNLELQNNQHQFALEQQEHASMLQQQNWETQFNMQNEYNSPEANLQRLKDAGLNPLYSGEYAQGNTMSPAASAPSGSISAPSDGLPNMQPFSPLGTDAVNMYTALREDARQQDQHQYNIELLDAETNKLLADAHKSIADGKVSEKQLSEMDSKIKLYESEVFKNYHDTIVNVQNFLQTKLMNDFERELQTKIQQREDTLAASQLDVDASIIYNNRSQGSAALQNAETNASDIQKKYEHLGKQLQQDYDKHKNDLAELKTKNINDFVLKILDESTRGVYDHTSAVTAVAALHTIYEYLNTGAIGGKEPIATFSDRALETWNDLNQRRTIINAANNYKKGIDAYLKSDTTNNGEGLFNFKFSIPDGLDNLSTPR